MIKNLIKNLFSKAEADVTAAEQNANTYTDTSIAEQTTYSTTEQAVGTWIDGKTVYRRVFTGTLGSSPCSIPNAPTSSEVTPIKVNGLIKSGTAFHQIGSYLNANNWSGVWWTSSLQIYFGSAVTGSGNTYELIIYYAK